MHKRIIFISNVERELFFNKILEAHQLSSLKKLRALFFIPKSTLELYKNGKRTIPYNLYLNLSKPLAKADKILFNKAIRILDSNWGSIMGGKTTYTRHKEIFDNGRKKAINIMQKKADSFDIFMPLNHELAYFLGLFIGDGFTNKYRSHYIIQFTGDKRYELSFYKNLISNYSMNLFNLTPLIQEDKHGNFLRFNLYSKQLFKMITQRFNISAGRKSRTVLIPREILSSNPKNIFAFLRGLYDAEGCVFFDKRLVYNKPYVRIELHMCNLLLLKQVYNLLKNFGINSTLGTSKDNLRVTIYTEEMVKKFINKIGFSNPKQLEKLKRLK